MLSYPIFVSCPKGLENLLMLELQELGLNNAKNSPQGVTGDASLDCIYQIALWSRLANRLQDRPRTTKHYIKPVKRLHGKAFFLTNVLLRFNFMVPPMHFVMKCTMLKWLKMPS